MKNIRDHLIQAGLEELNQYGPTHFSVRRVASICGVSCAAPYKHFQNKTEYLAAILEYANSLLILRQQEILRQHPTSTRKQILLICEDYIHFLVENPYLRSALMTKDEHFDEEHLPLKSQVSQITQDLVEKYCLDVQMPEPVARIKLFVVRSLLYGAALMMDNGEMPNTPEVMEEIIRVIDREFYLP